MERPLKRRVIVGVVAALAVAGGGAAIASTQLGSPKEESQAIVNDAAKQLGVEPSALSDALKKALGNRVDAAVAAGRLTKEQGDALKAKIQSGDFPIFGGSPHEGFGHFGHFGGLDAAATYLGVTAAELETELQGGKTLAQVATDHGKTADGLVQALADEAKTKLDADVKAGRLTQAQEDSILADMKQHLTDLVNGKAGPSFGRGGDHFGHFGRFGGLDAAATYLGVTAAELETELQGGKTLAQVATDHGKTAVGLVQALADEAKTKLDAAVTAGRLTQAQEGSILTELKQHLTDLVNGTGGPGFGPGFGHGFDHDRGFDDGPAVFSAPTT